MKVEVELRITLENVRNARGTTRKGEEGSLNVYPQSAAPRHVELSISEAEARELWTQIGLKLRRIEK